MTTLTRRAWYYGLSSGTSILATFITLPVLTRRLGPQDYGGYALVTSYANIGTLLATAGLTFVMASNLPTTQGDDRRDLVSTLVACALVVAAAFGLLSAGALLLFRANISAFDGISGSALAFAVGTVVLNAPWLVITDVLTIDGRAGQYAGLLVTQTVVTSAATVAAVYVLDLRMVALFAGGFVGVAALFVAMVVVAHDDLGLRVRRRWLREVIRTAPSVVASNAAEAFRNVVERTVVSARLGLDSLGVYSHAQAYRAYGIEAVNPISRSLYPVALAEAREPGSSYVTTKNAWALAQVMVVGAGLLFAFVGDDIVALLTHGKFDGAGDLATAWMAVLLLQMSGKPQTLTLVALGQGARLARASSVSMAVGVVALLALVPSFGLVGAVAAQAIQFALLRLLAGRAVRRLRPVPFQDQWVLGGIVAIGAAYGLRQAWDPSTALALTGLALSWLLLVGIAREVLALPARRLLGRAGLFPRARPGEPGTPSVPTDPPDAPDTLDGSSQPSEPV